MPNYQIKWLPLLASFIPGVAAVAIMPEELPFLHQMAILWLSGIGGVLVVRGIKRL